MSTIPGLEGAPAHDVNGLPLTLPTLYKIVGPQGEPVSGGLRHFRWSLPHGDKPGEWHDIEGDVVPCRNALHVTTADNHAQWWPSNVPAVTYRAEVRGLVIDAGGKYACQSVRLLPHAGTATVDVDAERAAYLADVAAADARLARDLAAARRRVSKEYGPDVRKGMTATWRAYTAAVGPSAVPKGHPAYVSANRAATLARLEAAAHNRQHATISAARERLATAERAARLDGI